MNYYKIIIDKQFIGAISSKNFIRYIPLANCFERCQDEYGQYVSYLGELYRDTWMAPTNSDYVFNQATITPIDETEYQIYVKAIESNELIEVETEPEITVPIEDPNVIFTLETVKQLKILEMSNNCRKSIENGFDIEIRGETKHFSLTTHDQLNLISLDRMAQNQTLIPYHADGEDVIFYTSEEINDIIDTANALKIYHTTYYNALKKYINALTTVEEIAAVEYGIEIPEEYQTDVFKAIGGN